MSFHAGKAAVVVLFLVALAALMNGGVFASAAQAQGAVCIPGQNCCIVAASMEEPKRYAVVCDRVAQNAQSAAALSGYPVVVHGPDTFDRCGAWMAAAKIPGWEQYRNASAQPSSPAPKPEAKCTSGKNCCYIGANHDQPPRYAIGYDGATETGSQNLAVGGYTVILFGPVSIEACHAWWNDNIAVGIGQNFPPAPSGAVPFPPGAFAGKGPKPTSACTMGQNCCYVGAKDVLVGLGTATRTDYAIAYDGAVLTGYHNLANTGHRVVFGPVSTEACHGWWNDNIVARGLAAPFPPAPAGSIPFPPGTFRQGGPYDRVTAAQAAIGSCEFEQAKAAIDALPAGPVRDGVAGTYTSAYEHEARTNALWEEAKALDAKGQQADALQLLNQALANTRCSNYRGRIEATIARLGPVAAPPPSPPGPAKPPAPAGAAEDQQCKKLHDQAVWTSARAASASAAAVLGAARVPPPSGSGVLLKPLSPNYTETISLYNQALSLYRQGAELCRQGPFPAEFAKGIQDTTRELRAIGGRS